jgi:hypothetical protein
MKIYDRYRFFKEHAGGVAIIDANGRPSGINARVALDLARAERLLDEAEELGIAATTWQADDEPYDYNPRGRGFEDADADEARKLFESNEWTGPFGCVVTIGDEPGASLWGILVGPQETDDPYCRVVRAELAEEIEDELRQAIGDYRDCATFAGPDLSNYNAHGPLI